jgi:hypothetical protein
VERRKREKKRREDETRKEKTFWYFANKWIKTQHNQILELSKNKIELHL